jgi:hypothetical protein
MHKSNLCLHTGASNVSREQIVAVPVPQRTRTWVPLPHHKLLEGVEGQLQQAGLTVASEAHGLTKDGNRYFGLLQVNSGVADQDFGLVVGIRNSHDRSFPAGIACGAAVFICDNLSFVSEIRLARRHTTNIERDLPNLIQRAVGQLGDNRLTQQDRFEKYQQHELTDAAAHDLVVRALDTAVLPVTLVPDVLREWREPRHSEFRTCGKTAWRLFNAVTECLKGGLGALPRRTQALHGLLDNACGLSVTSKYGELNRCDG